jgi:hypothetical protein
VSKSDPKAYIHRHIDDSVVEEACRWNTDAEGLHAHWIHIKSTPDTGSHELLKYLVRELPQRGFTPIYVDAQEQLSPEIPGPLAWSVFQILAKRPFRRLKHALDDFKQLPTRKKILAILLVLASVPILMLAVEAKNYLFNNSPDQMSLRGFWKDYLSKQWEITPLRTLLEVSGIAGLVALCVTSYRVLLPKVPRWDADFSSEFADWSGYLKLLHDIGGNCPFAIIVDNAPRLPLIEGKVINQLLLASDFRCVCISVGLPRNLQLGKIRQRTFDLPKLPVEILAVVRANEERIRNRVAEEWAKDEGQRIEGAIGSYEWTAFCALLDRRWIEAGEMKRLYTEVSASPVMALIGLHGPHPAESPETGLREEGTPPQSFDSTYCRMEQDEIALNRPDLLAKIRLMLTVFGLNLDPRPRIWREWDPEHVRTLLLSADQAADLADETAIDELLDKVLVGDDESKARLLCDVVRLLVTAAEIRFVYGNLVSAASICNQ